jgi:hypothetical protein
MYLHKIVTADSAAPRELSGAPAGRLWRWLVAIGFILVAALLAGRVWWLPFKASLDPNEGWNAFHSLEAMRGSGLYPSLGALTGNNYPPLSFYIVGVFGELIGDQIIAGRIVSLVAILSIALLIPACIRRLGARAEWAPVAGALLFLGYNCIARPYFALDDPQWLGHLFMTGGLLVLLCGDEIPSRSSGRIVAAALLMLAGGLTKHNLVAFPIGTTLWLAIVDRRALGRWVAALLLGGALSAGLCWLLYGPDLFAGVFGAPRTYSLSHMLVKGTPYALLFLPAIWCARFALRGRSWTDPRALVVLIAAIALVTGIIERSGAGVCCNAHFETMIALSILAPLGLEQLGGRQLTLGLALLLCPFLIQMPKMATNALEDFTTRQETAEAWADAIARVRALPGPVACENQALCYWAGKSSEMDFFFSAQRLELGSGDRAVRAAIGTERFRGVALIDADDGSPPQGPIVRLFDHGYRPVFDDGYIRLLVARQVRPGMGSPGGAVGQTNASSSAFSQRPSA